MKSNIRMWDDIQEIKQQIIALETVIARLLEQVNAMQQAKKPGRPKKVDDAAV